jgi:hypothetical protein
MSIRLVELMTQLIVREGSAGKARLSLAAGRGDRMIERYVKGLSVPSQSTSYKLARACGCSDSEALALASEASESDPAKKA